MARTFLMQVLDEGQFNMVWTIVHTEMDNNTAVIRGYHKVTGFKPNSTMPLRTAHDDWVLLDKARKEIGRIRIRHIGRNMSHKRAVETMLAMR